MATIPVLEPVPSDAGSWLTNDTEIGFVGGFEPPPLPQAAKARVKSVTKMEVR
jgi:hypothetical protein